MKNYCGLIVAVENYHDKKISPVKFAENDATKLFESLINLGCDQTKFEVLIDHTATFTTILEKLRYVSRNAEETDVIIFYYAGHGFLLNGKNQISSVDTSLTSLDSTTININTILSTFEKSKSSKIIAFLDCCHSGIEFSDVERGPITDFSIDDLKYEYDTAEHLTVFASCKSSERSQADLERKHGVWSYYLIKALSGKAKDIYDKGLLFSDKLQKYLAEKTFHRVKKITVEKKNQTPVKFGKETSEKFIVADLNPLLAEIGIKVEATGIKFESAVIVGSEEDSVKNLPGFKSGHKIPKEIDSYHNGWIKSIAYDLIKSELDDVARILKEKLKYKRKDISDTLIEDGRGQLVTNDFDYIVSVEQSDEDPGTFVLTRSIENFKNSEILSNPLFNEIFEDTFNELQFFLSKKVNVDDLIDIVEQIDNDELVKVRYNSMDTTSCKIFLPEFTGYILVEERAFCIIEKTKTSPKNLVLNFQNVYQQLGSLGLPKLLPNKSE